MKANKFPEYDTPTKHGKNVVVFGGGNVAMDAVRTAKRLGAEHAIIAYRRTEDEMPCRRAELHHAKAEGVEVLPLVSPLEFVAGEDGSVCAVKVQKMELGEPDESGRRRPVPIEGAIEEIPCDVAISAIGTNANPFAAKIGGKMELNKWGYIVADEETGQTTDPRIWAGRRHRHRCRYGHSGDGRRQEGRCFHHQEPAGRIITCSASYQTARSPSSTRPAGTFFYAGRPTTAKVPVPFVMVLIG